MAKRIGLLITLALASCTTTDEPGELAGPTRDIDKACGEMPWPEPGWKLTSYPGTTGQVCMTDADYVARDKYHQQLRDWAVCAEIQACRNRGECL